MRHSGRLSRQIWRAHVQLRKSPFLRESVRFFRGLAPHTRDRHLRGEVRFWRRWLATEGLSWPEDYVARFDPSAPLQDYLVQVCDRLGTSAVDLLDVGAGPVTVVGKVHPSKTLSITATDVLAKEFDALLARIGVEPLVRTLHAEAENLRQSLGDREFDVVHAVNSLDHVRDPVAAVEEMLGVARHGGYVVLLHEENEGSNELYNGLHQWDFRCDDGDFVVAGPGPRGPRRNVSAMVSGRANVECSTRGGRILVIMRKLSNGKGRT